MSLPRWLKKSGRNTYKRSEKLREYRFWTSLDEFPIWHWWQFGKTKDFRYLLKLDDYSQPVKLSHDFKKALSSIFEGFIMDMKDLDLSIEIAEKDYLINLYKFIAKIVQDGNVFKDHETMDAGFKILIKLADTKREDPQLEWLYKLPIKDQELRRGLVDIARTLVEYKKIKNRPRTDQDLNDMIVRINTGLGVDIDERYCSVNKFKAYQKQYIEKMNYINNMKQ